MLGNRLNNRDAEGNGGADCLFASPDHRFGVLPQDKSLERRIERIFSTIPRGQQESDIMPIATIISAWVLAHLSQYEALPMARLEMVCKRNYVDATSVIHRISHNNEVAFVTKGDTDRLVMRGDGKGLKQPILIPEPRLDASMNYEDRTHYIIDAYGFDQPIRRPPYDPGKFDINPSEGTNLPPFCEPPNDDLADLYLTKIESHLDISINICLFSLAVFYATPQKRTQIRGFAAFLLDELYHSMRGSKSRFTNQHSWGTSLNYDDYAGEDP